MAYNDLLATKMPLYLSAGTRKLTLTVTAASSDTYAYPSFNASVADTGLTAVSPYAGASSTAGVANFKAWWLNNPFLITRLNVRAYDKASMPGQVIVETPDVFSGNMQNQIIDLGANTVSTQFQDAIVTVDNLELFVSRNSTIKVMGNASAASKLLYLDVTIQAFISLEFCLQQAVLGGALNGNAETITEIVGSVDNEGTKVAVLDATDSSGLTATKRAQIMAALKAKNATSAAERRAALRL